MYIYIPDEAIELAELIEGGLEVFYELNQIEETRKLLEAARTIKGLLESGKSQSWLIKIINWAKSL